MTFEEYKKECEIFGKIDSPEKLAICERQFNNYLLNIEDQNYFEPFAFDVSDDMTSIYKRNLYELLPFNKVREDELSFLIKPSFDPESMLLIKRQSDRYILSYNKLTVNYWSVFCDDNKIVDVPKTVSTTELSANIGHKLFKLLDEAIQEARPPKGGVFTLDGVVFILARILNGKQVIVFKHSPGQGSRTANIIDLLINLVDNIENLNETVVLSVEEQIDSISRNM